MDDEVGYPPSTPDAVILPITQVLEGPHGGVYQVDSKYNEYLRHKISPEEFRVTVEYLNELLRELTYTFWPFFFMIVPVIGCLFACWLIRHRMNERRKVFAQYLEYMNDHIYYHRGILWRAVEFSQFSWVFSSFSLLPTGWVEFWSIWSVISVFFCFVWPSYPRNTQTFYPAPKRIFGCYRWGLLISRVLRFKRKTCLARQRDKSGNDVIRPNIGLFFPSRLK